MTTKKNPIGASVSVPVAEQEQFNENKTNLMNQVASAMGKSEKYANSLFSKFIRLVINTGVLETRDNGTYLVVKLYDSDM